MKKAFTLHHPIIIFGFPFLLLSLLVLVSLNPLLIIDTPSSSFYNGLILDFIITVPFVYCLLIRKKEIPKITIISCSIIGLLIAKQVIPINHQYLLQLIIQYGLPLLELIVVAYVGYKMFMIRNRTKALAGQQDDLFSRLRTACTEVLPGIAGTLLATEIAVIYYSLFCWKKKRLFADHYSYYKKSGIYMIISTFLFLIIIETGVMHLLLHKYTPILAMVLSALSIYTLLQVIALMRSFTKLPIEIDLENRKLKLRYGFFSDCLIDIDNIEHIVATSRAIENIDGGIKLSPLDMLDTHNLIVHLKNESILNGLYGRKKPFTAIAIYIDEKEKFLNSINALIKL